MAAADLDLHISYHRPLVLSTFLQSFEHKRWSLMNSFFLNPCSDTLTEGVGSNHIERAKVSTRTQLLRLYNGGCSLSLVAVFMSCLVFAR